jgi:hypothetical protein
MAALVDKYGKEPLFEMSLRLKDFPAQRGEEDKSGRYKAEIRLKQIWNQLAAGADQVNGVIKFSQVKTDHCYLPRGSVLVDLVCRLPKGVKVDVTDTREIVHGRYQIGKRGRAKKMGSDARRLMHVSQSSCEGRDRKKDSRAKRRERR